MKSGKKISLLGGWSQTKADFMLGIVAMTWGSSYLLMKIGLGGISPYTIIALRFGIAFIAVALLFAKRLKNTTKKIIMHSALLGLMLFGLFAFLLHGMQSTTASNAGFLTSTTVVFVPIFNALIIKKMPARPVIAGCLVTLTGIALLSLQGSLVLHSGDALCLIGAVSYAFYIILTDVYSKKEEGLLLGIWQLGFAALYGFIMSLIFETPSLPQSMAQWGAILGLALICSGFGFVVQPVAQKYTTPEHTGLLFALEPVFSAVLAYIFIGEKLSTQGYTGAVLVMLGVVIASVLSKDKDTDNESQLKVHAKVLKGGKAAALLQHE